MTYLNKTQLVYNVKDFGAKGDGVADDTTAIQAAVTAIKQASPINSAYSGVQLFFPHGVYFCSSQINFDNTGSTITTNFPCVTIGGAGGSANAAHRAASTLIYTGTGSTNFISARASSGFTIEKMSVIYYNDAFDGYLIDVGVLSAVTSSGVTLRDSTFSSDGQAYTSCKTAINLEQAEDVLIHNNTIGGAVEGIRGIAPSAAGQTNVVVIDRNWFGNCTYAIINACGQGWTISGNTFEAANAPGTGLFVAITDDCIAPYISYGLVIQGNWMGDPIDSTANRATGWIYNVNLQMNGAVIQGNTIFSLEASNGHHNKDSIVLGDAAGVSIIGNALGTIDFSEGTGTVHAFPQGISVIGNSLGGIDSVDSPFFRDIEQIFDAQPYYKMASICTIQGNYCSSNTNVDLMNVCGHIVGIPILNTKPTVASATNSTVAIDGNDFQGTNDLAGRITLTVTGPGTAAGAQVTLTYARGYDPVYSNNPKVVLQAENAVTAAVITQIYVTSAWNQFIINTDVAGLPAGTYVWAYHVIG